MFFKLLIAIIIVPALEIFLLLKVSVHLGFGFTFVMVILTGIVGAKLAHSQGLSVLRKIQSELSQGRAPAETIVEGLCVLVAGVVLLTPGFITDAIGFSLLIPQVRRKLRGGILKFMLGKVSGFKMNTSGMHRSASEWSSMDGAEVKSTWHVEEEKGKQLDP